jgi:hypothetical protein
VAARKAGLTDEALDERFARIGEVPFSSERKLMSTVHTDAEQQDRLLVFTKGAPDILLNRCHAVWVGDGPQPLTEERRARIRSINEQLAGEALRTLGIAYRSLPHDALQNPDAVNDQIEQELVFLGLVGMIDPPRDEVKDAVGIAPDEVRAPVAEQIKRLDRHRPRCHISANHDLVDAERSHLRQHRVQRRQVAVDVIQRSNSHATTMAGTGRGLASGCPVEMGSSGIEERDGIEAKYTLRWQLECAVY